MRSLLLLTTKMNLVASIWTCLWQKINTLKVCNNDFNSHAVVLLSLLHIVQYKYTKKMVCTVQSVVQVRYKAKKNLKARRKIIERGRHLGKG